MDDQTRWRALDRLVAEIKARNAGVPAKKIEAAIEKSVRAARRLRAGRWTLWKPR